MTGRYRSRSRTATAARGQSSDSFNDTLRKYKKPIESIKAVSQYEIIFIFFSFIIKFYRFREIRGLLKPAAFSIWYSIL